MLLTGIFVGSRNGPSAHKVEGGENGLKTDEDEMEHGGEEDEDGSDLGDTMPGDDEISE